MKKLKTITTVYSYYFPEIRHLIDNLTRKYPHDVFLKSISPGLDDFHIPIIDKYLDFQAESVPHLKDFFFKYPVAGATEYIKEVLTLLQTKGIKKIYVWKGEYEGYKEMGKTRDIQTIEVDFKTDPKTLEKGYWFLSNPSARDGNIIPNEFINRICEAGHQIFYDLSYLGLTNFHKFDLGHPNIFAAVISFSKPYGLFYYRVGFAFSRVEIPALYGNKWFKNIFSLLIIDKIIMEMSVIKIPSKYKLLQEQILKKISKDCKLDIRASDVLLLGYLTKQDVEKLSLSQIAAIKDFRRGDFYRFCLTPYFEELEKNEN